MTATSPVKVFIVDDSAVVRQVLSELLVNAQGIQVIGTAADPLFALQKMEKLWPDVILLDIEMPRMDGLTFLRKIMKERPTPVIICSTLTQEGASVCVDALNAGAVELITKPKVGLKEFLVEERQRLIHVIQSAAQARLNKLRTAPNLEVPRKLQLDDFPETRATNLELTTERVVAIGASTGGTQALETVLTALPATAPGIAIVQHMPEKFTATFADRLNRMCQIEVREAVNGDRIRQGLALIAPGGRHMQVKRSGAQYVVEVRDGPPVNRHKPSVDVLFRSAANHAGPNALGIILTGMGDDGAEGLLRMRQAGAPTIAQDEDSCVVFGMPKEAIKRDAAAQILPLQQMAGAIMKFHQQWRPV